ncbi:flavodoxin family protein [Nocardia thailandica]|uniref:Flavodoxin family protein n=1 Tax=Nocardia thailandica TaxID=257275 RepID=A0ABW6PTL2_9NOCA
MRALVVYESLFGNTEAVARAVAEGLRDRFEVELCPVATAAGRPAPDVDLLVVGGPTHAFGLSRPSTRRDGATRARIAEGADLDLGVREWLDAALPVAGSPLAAAFGTKAAHPRLLPGSAAHGIAKRLRHLGYRPACPPQDFTVEDVEGPLTAGELARAVSWGESLGAAPTPRGIMQRGTGSSGGRS